ncbi:ATP-binding protein [Desulfobacterales bacterium HSG16]|nr:ATP-binding protein [Desulfobacterales bacterium HSG16]
MKQLVQIENEQIVRKFSLEKMSYSMGRSMDNDIVFDTSKISRFHASLEAAGDTYAIVDNNSANHVFVNGEQVQNRCLASGDTISLSRSLNLIYLSDSDNEEKMADLANRMRNTVNKRDLIRLKKITDRIISLDSLENILKIILDEVAGIVDAERGFIVLMDENGKMLSDSSVVHNIPAKKEYLESSFFSHSTITKAIETRESVFIFCQQEKEEDLSISVIALQLQSIMCAPLIFGDNLTGILYVDSGNRLSDFTETDCFFFTMLADHAAIAVENAKRYGDSQTSFRKSEAKNQAIIRAIPDWIFVCDRNGRFLDYHGIDPKDLHLPSESFLDRTISELFSQDIAIQAMNGIKQAFESGEIQYIEYQLSESGELRDYEARIVISDIDECLLIVRDITTKKRIENALRNARNTAEAANRAKNEFLANMSHEIRTPLNAIMGFSAVLKERMNVPDHKKFMEIIHSSGKMLLSLINDILELSKIETGKMELRLEPVNLRNVFNDISHLFFQKYQEKGIEFKIDINESIPEKLMMDDIRIRQILVNLVGNALKFTHEGYVKLSVYPKSEPASDKHATVIFEVEDTGIGIPDDQQEIIFENFRQQDGLHTRKYGGIGLGLPIARRLAEMMGGTINLKSRENHGSRFQVVLPELAVISKATHSDKIQKGKHANIRFESARILLIGKSAYRDLIKKYLQIYPLIIFDAESGEQAMKLLGMGPQKGLKEVNEFSMILDPDLILTDVQMPGISGVELCRKIKSHNRFKDVKIIAVSDVDQKVPRRFDGQFDSFMTMPFNREILIRELAKYLPYVETALFLENDRVTTEPTDIKTPAQLKFPQELKQDILLKWEDSRDVMVFDDLKLLADDIDRMGKKYQWPVLMRWSETLIRNMNAFHMDALRTTFDQLPDIIKKIE